MEVSEAVRVDSVMQPVNMRIDYIKVGGSAGKTSHLRLIGLTFTVNDGVPDFLASLSIVKSELSLLDKCMVSSQT